MVQYTLPNYDGWIFNHSALDATYETVHAPPATVFLHDLHVQIPTECLFTVVLPQNVQVYRACWVISIFLTCLRNEAPYL